MTLLNKGIAAALIAGSVFFFSCNNTPTEVEVEEEVVETTADKGISGQFKLNAENTTFEWLGKKVTGQHNGTVDLAEGKITFNEGNITGGQFRMDMSTITVLDIEDEEQNGNLTGHLKSDDFFGVENHPFAAFTLTSADDKTMVGNLMIKDVSKVVKVPYEVTEDGHDLIVSGSFNVDRTEYGIKYGSGKFFEDLGDKMINDNFTLDFKIRLAEANH